MAYSVVALAGAGIRTFVEDPENPGTWVFLENALTMGAVESKRGFIETTPLASANKTFIAGDDEVSQSEIAFNDIPGNPSNAFFNELALAKAEVNFRIEFPNGRRVDTNLSLGGFGLNEPSRTEALKIMHPYQRNGEPLLSEWITPTAPAVWDDATSEFVAA